MDALPPIIPMDVGTSFTYSGYLLTHRQQIHNQNLNEQPMVNFVSYNSKRMFENMMQSFRRFIGEDEGSHSRRKKKQL